MTTSTKNRKDKITEIELVYRNRKPIDELPTVTSIDDASEILMQSWDKKKLNLQEQFKVLMMNNANKALGVSTVSLGGIDAVHSDLRVIFGCAIKAAATSIILAHNHPSGTKRFSATDIKFTKTLATAGVLLGINVQDHILITEGGFVSMQDSGQFPYHDFRSLELVKDPGNHPSPQVAKTYQPKKPAFYIFNQNSQGEKPIGAVFMHGKGNGFNIVFDEDTVINKTRYVAFPPKPKPEAVAQMAPPKQSAKRRSPGQKT
ncbi:MAG TPA: JAB domain-containing protein [Fluviicola sp.]|nr:JAB domain-containing protein [Fluviicola sp.]